MKIITSGKIYIDIDAYASCIAYAQFLNAKGIKAAAVCTPTLNESITATLRSLTPQLSTEYTPSPNDTFIILDVSNPDYFDDIVDSARIEEIIDHHTGFEEYWKNRPSVNVQIEQISSICTIIFELFEKEGWTDKISKETAQLLVAGILDNTLNFQAQVTTDRDKRAFKKLSGIAEISDDWVENYFQECQRSIEANIKSALTNDTKVLTFPSTGTIAVAQLTLWNGQKLIQEYKGAITEQLSTVNNSWVLNVLSIQDGKSYFLVSDEKLQQPLKESLDITFDGLIGSTSRMWLRKEIIAHLLRGTKDV